MRINTTMPYYTPRMIIVPAFFVVRPYYIPISRGNKEMYESVTPPAITEAPQSPSIVDTTVFSFSASDIDGNDVSMSRYCGKVLLIVNSASKGGQNKQVLKKLIKLQAKYESRGLQVLVFPCRQFLNQESKSNDKIKQRYLVKMGINFPVFSRINVNGDKQHPLFRWLKRQKPGPFGRMIDWNFTKFLVYPDGTTVKRFESSTNWKKMVKRIEKALNQKEITDASQLRIQRMHEAADTGQKNAGEVPQKPSDSMDQKPYHSSQE